MFDIEDTAAGEQAAPTIIKVVGVGGAGGNAVNRMIASGLKKVQFLALNTDVQALQRSNAQTRIAIGRELTGGLGAGGQPEIGEKAAIESKEEIKAELENTDMVFIAAGMGGGTGTGGAAVVAEIAKSCNALTVAVVTTPFLFEGNKKMLLAKQGIERLRKQVDTLILIPNQHLMKVVEANTPIKQAFLIADDVLYQGVQGISELITEPGEINIDFADVKTVMKGKGDALMGIGFGEGTNRAVDAAKEAISNPLLENATIDGAKSVLVNICGSDNLTLQEYQDVVELVTANCAEDALIIAGQAYNPELGDRIKVTVVATGFEAKSDEKLTDQVNQPNPNEQMDRGQQNIPVWPYGKTQTNADPSKQSFAQQPVGSRVAPQRPPVFTPGGNGNNGNNGLGNINFNTDRASLFDQIKRKMNNGGDLSQPAFLRFSQDGKNEKGGR